MITATAKKTSPQGAYERIVLQLAFSGSYPPGGDTVDLTAILNKYGLAPVGQPSLLPLYVKSIDIAMAGYYTQWIRGTTLANGKLQILQPGGSDYSAGAYGAPFTSTPAGEVWLEVELQDADR